MALLFELVPPNLLSFGHLRHGVSGPDLAVLPIHRPLSRTPRRDPLGWPAPSIPMFRGPIHHATTMTQPTWNTPPSCPQHPRLCVPPPPFAGQSAPDAEHLPTTSSVVSSTSTSRMSHYTTSLLYYYTKITFWLLSISYYLSSHESRIHHPPLRSSTCGHLETGCRIS